MPVVEFATRFRCVTCGMAVEYLNIITVPTFPSHIKNMTMQLVLPQGWSLARDGSIRCAGHEEKLVKPVRAVPQNAKMN
jgi:hypothetical protein